MAGVGGTGSGVTWKIMGGRKIGTELKTPRSADLYGQNC